MTTLVTIVIAMRFFNKLFDSESEGSESEERSASAATMVISAPSGIDASADQLSVNVSEGNASEANASEVIADSLQNRMQARTTMTVTLPPEVLALRAATRADEVELDSALVASDAAGAEAVRSGAENSEAGNSDSAGCQVGESGAASDSPDVGKLNDETKRVVSNPWMTPLSVPAPVAKSRNMSGNRTGASGTGASGTWARLQPPPEPRSLQRKVPHRKSTTPSAAHLEDLSETLRVATPTAETLEVGSEQERTVKEPFTRRLPKVMIRVTTHSKDTAELVRSKEDDEEPTHPGMGVPTPTPSAIATSGTMTIESASSPTSRLSSLQASGEPVLTDLQAKRLSDRLVMQVLLNTIAGLPPALRTRLANEDNSLDSISQATLASLASRLGTSSELARVLRETCENYSQLRKARRVKALTADDLTKSLALVKTQALAFRQCDEDNRPERRKLRRNLQRALTEVHLMVAERGDQALLHDLERRSVSGRIALLSSRFEVETANL